MVKMRKFVVAIMFVLLCCAVLADTSEFDGWIFTGDSVSVKDQVYFITISSTNEKISVESTVGHTFVNLGNCEKINVVKICLDNATYDEDLEKRKAEIHVYSINPDLKITRTIDYNELVIGNEATVSLTISNEGGSEASNVEFSDDFTSDVEITDTEGVDIVGSGVRWSGNINMDSSEEFTYKIKALEELDRSFKALVRYNDGFDDKELYSDAINLKITPFLRVIHIEGATTIPLGDSTNITINISNSDEDAVTINFLKMTIPKELSIITKPDKITTLDASTYQWTGVLSSNKSKAFSYIMKGVLEGNYQLSSLVEYKDDKGIVRTYGPVNTDLNVELQENRGIKIRTNLESTEKWEPNEEKEIEIWIQNLNPTLKIKNVDVNISNDIFDIPSVFIDEMDTSEQRKIVDIKVRVPVVDVSKSSTLNVFIDYETELGENFTEESESTININIPNNLDITQTADKSSVQGGEEIEFKVEVVNDRNDDVKDVKVFDIVPEEFKITGETSKVIDTTSKETTTAYIYKLTAPIVSEIQTFEINTTIHYVTNMSNITDSKITTITINPKDVKLGVTKKIPNNVYLGQTSNIDYTVSNNDDEAIYDIIVYFPKQYEFDLVGKKEYKIDVLDPGESLNVNGQELIRAKINGSISVAETLVTYRDSLGTLYGINISEQTITIKQGFIHGPAILVNKTISKTNVTSEEDVKITMNFVNIGDTEIQVLVKDLGKKWMANLPSNSGEKIMYETKINASGNYILPRTELSFNYLNEEYFAFSNDEKMFVTWIEPPKEEVKEENESETNKEGENKEETQEETESTEKRLEGEGFFDSEPKPKKKNFFVSIIEGIKNFLKNLF